MNCHTPCLNGRPRSLLQRGFTLQEILTVFAIIGIIASVALPSYRTYQKKTNRSAAAQLLLNIQGREEAYILDARAYTTDLSSAGLNITQDGWTCVAASCSNNHYTVAVAVGVPTTTPPSFTITATPKTTSINADDGNLTLNSLGVRARTAGDLKW